MQFLNDFLSEASDRHSFWLLALTALCLALRSLLPEAEKNRTRSLLAVTIIHFALVAATAWKQAADPAGVAKYLKLAAFIFSAAGFVGVFNLAVFSMFLGRLRVPMVLRDVVGVLVMLVVVLAVSPSLGFDWRGVAATATGFVAVIGLGMQETVSNVIGRVALQMDRSLHIGDWITVEGHYGQVTQMRWRYATIETNNFETVIIPNGQLMKSKFTVHGRRHGTPSAWRRWVYFNVEYKVPPAQVIRLVDGMLGEEKLPQVAQAPAAHCLLVSVEGGVSRYAVRYWLENPLYDDATDALIRTRLYYALKRGGIELAAPVQSLFITQQDEARAAAEAEADNLERSRALSRVGLFRGLTDPEREALARSMRRAPFAAGELLTRQGAEAHWLYIIEKGKVSVRVAVDGAEAREVATLGDGDYFGEMGLMTGEPRSATIVALSNTDCFRLDAAAFRELVENRPAIAEQMAELIARRRVETEAMRENLDKETQARRQAAAKSHLSDRIKQFFSIETVV
jgi:small-conductance mechanosensitive channel/CRP-like cAMP-binding protein